MLAHQMEHIKNIPHERQIRLSSHLHLVAVRPSEREYWFGGG